MSASPAEIPRTDGNMTPSALFVINLCASTSPMALSQPSAPELKRYTFFVSRQRDDGRDRFRLHMGYFASQEEADKLLDAVRDVYPAAWAGPAPANGGLRRNRVATPVAAVPPVVAPAPVVAAAAPAAAAAKPDVLESMSNVRNVIAQLGDEPAAPPAMPVAATAPASLSSPLLELTGEQVMRVLEDPAAPAPATQVGTSSSDSDVRMVTPEDTQTLADIQLDAENNAPPCFAVQLVWSVSPIKAESLTHLAIFDAYTLYNVEGSRQGRKWYGLRLGFFSDPASANQVANYVRSDYRSVAIVPVATAERDRAGGGTPEKGKPAARLGEPMKPAAKVAPAAEELQGFELLADDRPAPLKLDLDDKPAAKPVVKPAAARLTAHVPTVKPVAAATPRIPGKAAGKPVGKRVVVRARPVQPVARAAAPGAPQPLESTLEILGASTLSLDTNTKSIMEDSAVRKPLDRKGGNRFSKLLNRLSGG